MALCPMRSWVNCGPSETAQTATKWRFAPIRTAWWRVFAVSPLVSTPLFKRFGPRAAGPPSRAAANDVFLSTKFQSQLFENFLLLQMNAATPHLPDICVGSGSRAPANAGVGSTQPG